MASYSTKYDLFLNSTQSFCHKCNNLEHLVDSHIVKKDKDIYLRKFCTSCGESFVKISSDSDYYALCDDYLKQPDLPEFYNTKVLKGCPFDCGVCPQHQNHPCLGLFNITNECNMKCNICYYSSYPGAGKHKSIKEVKQMLATLIKSEGNPDLVQVTGGEPTIHPDIIEILKILKNSPVKHIMLNTNGIRISKDEDFIKKLKELGAGFEVYLQFDSLNEDTLNEIRNEDMLNVRLEALKLLEKYRISTTLVSVIKKGSNEHEIPKIIEFAKKYRCIRGVVFQPIQFAGRVKTDISSRILLSEIRNIIIKDEINPFTSEDMIPLPCDPHKICVGYAAKSIDNGIVNIFPVTGHVPKEYILKQEGTISFEQDKSFVKTLIKTINLETAMSKKIISNSIKQKLFCCWPSFFSSKELTYENVFRIVIMEFSDIYNFDSTNIKRECNFMVEENRLIPFSTSNMGIKFFQS